MSDFDLRTHVRSPKGDIVSKQPYRLKISRGEELFERPPHSGNWFTKGGVQVAKGDVQPEKKPEYKIAELEALLASAEAELKLVKETKALMQQYKAPEAFEASKAQDFPASVEPAPAVLTQKPAQAQTKEVPKIK